jgi:hypothetical protein
LFQALADRQGQSVISNQAILDLLSQVANDRWNVLLGKGNECFVNGWYPIGLTWGPVGRVLVSQGSTGATPLAPHEQFAQWETRLTPYHKRIDDIGAGALEMYAGYTGFAPVTCPIIVSETAVYHDTNPDQYGDFRITDPADAEVAGANAGAGPGHVCVATTEGLMTRPNGPIADQCVRAFLRRFWRAVQ